MNDIIIKTVSSRKELKEFISVPNILYADDKHYRSPLVIERLKHLDPNKNPYFQHAEHCYFIAYRAGKAVGRISAQIDQHAQISGEPKLGHFGLLAAQDGDVLAMLFHHVETWHAQRGVTQITGPYSLSINDEAGLLVEGFDTPPYMMMNYALPWMNNKLESVGLTKAKDLIAFHMDIEKELPALAQRLEEKIKVQSEIVLRNLNKADIDNDLKIILDIFNQAWAQNWGFVKMNEQEIQYNAKNLKQLINPNLVHIAEINNTPAAMIVALPDLNDNIKNLGGRLLPFGWCKLLWNLNVKGTDRARILLMGIKPEYLNKFLSSHIALKLMEAIHKSLKQEHYKQAEFSWILEDNISMIKLIEMSGAQPYKRYRIYQKQLT